MNLDLTRIDLSRVGSRTIFLTAILLVACGYTFFAFRLDFTIAAGRPGPGFFPRLVGSGLIVLSATALWHDLKKGVADASFLQRDTVLFGSLIGLCVLGFSLLGSWLAIGLFLFVALSIFNRTRHALNLAVSIVLPLGFYLLFDAWLGVPFPEGILRLIP